VRGGDAVAGGVHSGAGGVLPDRQGIPTAIDFHRRGRANRHALGGAGRVAANGSPARPDDRRVSDGPRDAPGAGACECQIGCLISVRLRTVPWSRCVPPTLSTTTGDGTTRG